MQNRGGSGGGRQACGSLCPNRVQDLAERLGKKLGKAEKKVPRKISPRSNPIVIYNDPPPDSVDLGLLLKLIVFYKLNLRNQKQAPVCSDGIYSQEMRHRIAVTLMLIDWIVCIVLLAFICYGAVRMTSCT